MGDPGGIGLEVILKAISHFKDNWPFIPILICSEKALSHPFHQQLLQSIRTKSFIPTKDAKLDSNHLFIDYCSLNEDYAIAEHTASNGRLAFSCLERAVYLLQHNFADSLCTAPLSKLSLKWASLPYTGHTTSLASLTKTDHVSMAFSSPELRVLLHSIHIPLHEVTQTITEQRLKQTFNHAVEFSKACGFTNARIAVAGLNPHAGERGKLGFEDSEIIAPLIKHFQNKGVQFSGPHPADTIFWYARQNHYDTVVALYHDQALIPVKTLAFDLAVNVTIGLPFIRTSPDHGTAFDIAYKNTANPNSTIEAIQFILNAQQPS